MISVMDVKRLSKQASVSNRKATFIFVVDTQTVEESFFEDINSMLSSGEVPHLFRSDVLEEITTYMSTELKKEGVDEDNNQEVYAFLLDRVEANLRHRAQFRLPMFHPDMEPDALTKLCHAQLLSRIDHELRKVRLICPTLSLDRWTGQQTTRSRTEQSDRGETEGTSEDRRTRGRLSEANGFISR